MDRISRKALEAAARMEEAVRRDAELARLADTRAVLERVEQLENLERRDRALGLGLLAARNSLGPTVEMLDLVQRNWARSGLGFDMPGVREVTSRLLSSSTAHMLDFMQREQQHISQMLERAGTHRITADLLAPSTVEMLDFFQRQCDQISRAIGLPGLADASLLSSPPGVQMLDLIHERHESLRRFLGGYYDGSTDLGSVAPQDLDGRLGAILDELHGLKEAVEAAPPRNRRERRAVLWLALLVLFQFMDAVLFAVDVYERTGQVVEYIKTRIEPVTAKANAECHDLKQLVYEHYLVDRQTAVSEKPRAKSTVLDWLSPKELVWVIDQKGCWAHVVYVLDDEERSGWARKKYLTRKH